MNKNHYPVYYKGHPKLYVKPKPIFWWVHKWVHARFILRELTSVPVAWFAVLMIAFIRALRNGPEAYEALITWLGSPLALSLNIFSLVFVLYHSITWFNLAPKALVIRIGNMRIPGILIAGANYGAWLVLSAAVIWLFTMI